MLERLKKHNKLIGLVILVLGLFVVGTSAQATLASATTNLLGMIMGLIISGLGVILTLVIEGLVWISGWQSFINSNAVSLGWATVRDISNMFFVVVLLIIAFGTILHLENYNYKKWLPKLILMAILINFSKIICGLLIDVAQVVMLTFVNSFKAIAAANITDILNISGIVTMAKNAGATDFWTIIGAYFLGIIYLLVAIVVIGTMIIVLAMRVVMIWIYVVLSPLAYLMAAFPGGKKYSSQWWSEFTKNLVVGPVLAFFIWLSLAALATSSNIGTSTSNTAVDPMNALIAQQSGMSIDNNLPVATTQSSTPAALIRFVIAIGMLIGGLKISQEIGGQAGSLAGKGMSALNKGVKIGAGGIAAVTGYRYASGVMKSYRATRKTKRQDKYNQHALQFAKGIGTVKKNVLSNPVNWAGRKIKSLTYGGAGAEADRLTQEAKKHREEAELVKEKIKNKEQVGDWKYSNENNRWENNSGKIHTDQQMNNIASDMANKLNNEADEKENQAQEQRKKQKKRDNWVKWAVTPAALGLSAVFGGVPGLIAAGTFGAAQGMKRAGTKDLDIGSNFRTKTVSENREKMKNDSNESVLATMDDYTKSAFTRTAATLEAMSRKLLSGNQAKLKVKEIKSNMGGTNKKGEWRDSKLGNYVDAVVNKNYPVASKTFQNLDSKEPDVKQKAIQTISSRFRDGTYTLDLDMTTLEKSMDILTRSLKTKDFVAQFKALKDSSKKDAIVGQLKSVGTFEAKEKLARVKDLDTAFGSDQPGKEKALANFSFEDLTEVFRKGSKVEQEAIKKTVAGSNQKNKLDIFVNAKNELEGNSLAVIDMRRKLGLSASSENKASENKASENKSTDYKQSKIGY